MPRLLAALVLLVGVVRVPLAQTAAAASGASPDSAAPAESADALVLDHDFTGTPEFVRLFLQGRQVYRAELSTPDVTLEIRSPRARVQLPRVYPITAPSGSGESVYEIYTEADGEYELRPIALAREAVATRLRLYRDAAESRRRMSLRSRPGWEIGIELAGGWNSGFAQSQDPVRVAEGGEPGSDVELCFAARRAPGVSRLGMCALGIGYQSQHGARNITWFFTEPRFRVVGRAAPGRSNWEGGVLFRAGFGAVSRTNVNPVLLAPGLYAARHIRTAPDGRGWSFHASWSRAWYRGFAKPFGVYDPETGNFTPGETKSPSGSRVLLGVGWYQ